MVLHVQRLVLAIVVHYLQRIDFAGARVTLMANSLTFDCVWCDTMGHDDISVFRFCQLYATNMYP